MKLNVCKAAAAMAAAALVLTACGGGGGGGGTTPQANLQLAGTAATGAALASAQVEVKCSSGSGTATTAADGSYSVAMTGGALPCVVKVSGTQAGASIVLHAVADTGSTDAGTTHATANVTPVTEMVLAHLVGQLPEDFFAAFAADDAARITPQKLQAAERTVVAALNNAGIDLGAIDPFKAKLVAATGGDAGDAYDQLLDQLAASVPSASLPQVVNQIALAQDDTSLADAMEAVAGGTLPGCAAAVSGKYRSLDYTGRSAVRDVNFGAHSFSADDGTSLTLTPDPSMYCTFGVSGTEDGQTVSMTVVMSDNGIGAYQKALANGVQTVGFLFPVQALSYAKLAGGTWTVVKSGQMALSVYAHAIGPLVFDASSPKATQQVCDTSVATTWTCQASPPALDLVARKDGGFDLYSGTDVAGQLYGYRSASGTLTLFGSSDVAGTGTGSQQYLLVGGQLPTLALPPAGSRIVNANVGVTLDNGVPTAGVSADSYTVDQADASTGTVTRTRNNGRVEIQHYNAPLTGLIYREAGTGFLALDQVKLPGTGLAISVNALPSTTEYQFTISVGR